MIHAIPTPKEKQNGKIERKLLFKTAIHRYHDSKTESNFLASFQKDLTEAFFIDENIENGKKEPYHRMLKFISFTHQTAVSNKYTKMLCLEISMTPKLFMKTDHE